MTTINGAIAFILAGVFGLACSGSGVGPDRGEGGAGGMAGAVGSGGSGSGGAIASGGGGGTNAGGSGAGGASGCPPIFCLIPTCPGSLMTNPDNPCGCPICVPSDAGVDVACQPLPCPFLPVCPNGHYVPQACGCAICEPLDAEAPDTDGCAPIACLIPTCPDGLVANPDKPCGCPVCAP